MTPPDGWLERDFLFSTDNKSSISSYKHENVFKIQFALNWTRNDYDLISKENLYPYSLSLSLSVSWLCLTDYVTRIKILQTWLPFNCIEYVLVTLGKHLCVVFVYLGSLTFFYSLPFGFNSFYVRVKRDFFLFLKVFNCFCLFIKLNIR